MDYLSDSEEFKKKKSFLLRRNKGKAQSERYNQILYWLFPTCKENYMILDLAESDKIRETSKPLTKKYDVYKIQTTFSDKRTLEKIINTLCQINDTSVYFFSSYAEYCGLVRLSSLSCLNVSFDYKEDFPSMFWFRTLNMENEFFIDFGKEDNALYLEIEVAGRLWSFVKEVLQN